MLKGNIALTFVRGVMLSLVFLAFFLPPLSAVAKPMPITVALDWYINPDQAPLLIADAKGYFAAQGLDVHFVTPTNSTEPVQLVADHHAQVAVTYQTELLEAVSQGVPIVRFATLINHPLDCITVLADGPIHTLADLRGQTLGYSGSSMQQAMLRAMLAHNGLTLAQVQLVNIRMNLIQALLSHRVVAVSGMMRTVEPVTMAAMGHPTRLFFPEDNGVPDHDELLLVVNNSDRNAPWLKGFVAALTQATLDIQRHPNATWALAAKTYPQALAPTPEMAKTNHQIWLASVRYFDATPGAINAPRYQAFMAFMVQQGFLKQPLALARYAVVVS